MAEGLGFQKFEKPLSTLRPSTLAVLSQMLNPIKVIFTPTGHLRDWRGIAELMGCDILFIQSIEIHANPLASLIKENAFNFQISDLLTILEEIDRFDVIDDTIKLIEQDIEAIQYPDQISVISHPPQEIPELVTIRDFDYLKSRGTLPTYDAFILFAEEDREFVDLIIQKMEGEYGLKLCLKDRDLLPGLPFEHQAITKLISTRCNFVLPIFSPSFLKSSDNNFIVSFTEALGIERGCRKVIPCLYQTCTMPKSMSFYSRLDYTRSSHFWDFWDKMRKSIEHPLLPSREDPQLFSNMPEKNEMKDPGKDFSSSKEKLGETSDTQSSVSTESHQPLLPESKSNEPQSWIKKFIPKQKKKGKKKLEALAS